MACLVAAKFSPNDLMYLTWGWKSFSRSPGLGCGHILQFRYDGSTTLFMKFFEASGDRLECCAESSSSSNTDPSGGSKDKRFPSVKSEGDNFD